ncbi:hypothetical protein AXX17_AT3G38390 [Arabidopsis thaliana]|uniref:Uncharacterized protein n=1 Tax=Arabidopsis thaliana TaxID=3702 RepID=A0A178V9H9_ARATH|nr:hypothetical protein AXX17_AT3G38390 [Arabidopsis thaliana]
MTKRKRKLQNQFERDARIELDVTKERDKGAESHDSSDDEDDCPVIVEDNRGYTEVEPCLAGNQEEEDDGFIDVEICNNLEDHFGHDACEETTGENCDDSGDDIWDDDKIPDPLSDDDQEEAERPFTDRVQPDDLLALHKTFNNADEFKDLDDLNPIIMKIICHLHQNYILICKLPPSLLLSVYTIVVADSSELTIVTSFGPRDLVVVFLHLVSFVPVTIESHRIPEMHSETGEALEDKEISGESGDDGESKSTTHENHDHNDKHETSKISVNVSLVLVLSITQRQGLQKFRAGSSRGRCGWLQNSSRFSISSFAVSMAEVGDVVVTLSSWHAWIFIFKGHQPLYTGPVKSPCVVIQRDLEWQGMGYTIAGQITRLGSDYGRTVCRGDELSERKVTLVGNRTLPAVVVNLSRQQRSWER